MFCYRQTEQLRSIPLIKKNYKLFIFISRFGEMLSYAASNSKKVVGKGELAVSITIKIQLV
jgi:hypothetical protein